MNIILTNKRRICRSWQQRWPDSSRQHCKIAKPQYTTYASPIQDTVRRSINQSIMSNASDDEGRLLSICEIAVPYLAADLSD